MLISTMVINIFSSLDVYCPYKIFSTLIRGLHSEMAPLRKDKDIVKD